jgi:protein-tyrosine phosphatase
VGDRNSPAEATDKVNCVLNVAQNLHDDYWCRLHMIPQTTPYFRLPIHDDDIASEKYIKNLNCILDLADTNQWYPLLIHCLAGCHRSMTVAVYAEWRLQGRKSLEQIQQRVRQLLLNPHETGIFHKSLLQHMKS